MLAVAAHVAQVMAAEVKALAREQLLGALVGQRRPLQLEEQQRRLDRGLPLLHLLQQRAVRRLGGVGREAQRRVVARPGHEIVDRRQLAHRLAQARAVELAEPARVAGRERLGALSSASLSRRSTPS